MHTQKHCIVCIVVVQEAGFGFFFCVGWGEREKFENKLQKNAHYNLTITEQNKAN